MPRSSRNQVRGVEELGAPAWVRALNTEEERTRVREVELAEDRQRAREALASLEHRRAFLSGRAGAARLCWPILAPLRVDLLSLTTSSAVDEFGEPAFVDATFRIELNDPARTQLQIPIRVSAADAATPGLFAETGGPPSSPDYLLKAWYSLARFGRMLAGLADALEDGRVDTPLSRWLSADDFEEELAMIDAAR